MVAFQSAFTPLPLPPPGMLMVLVASVPLAVTPAPVKFNWKQVVVN